VTELRGARALVTGASGGLGRAIAIGLRAQGAELVVTGQRAEPLRELAALVHGTALVADLADPAQRDDLLTAAGEVDILVANAAVPASGELDDWDPDRIDRALTINLGSPIAMTRALLPAFRARGSGHFVFVSSLAGVVGTKAASLYSATKFGLRGFAGGLRSDLYRSGIGVSVVAPGFVREAGMFAATGATLPWGVGSVTPTAVADGVIKAIRRDRAEVVVAPLALRAGAFLGALAPGPAAAIQARFGAELSARMAAAQRDRR
jgi:short-subunit dehydrogenase